MLIDQGLRWIPAEELTHDHQPDILLAVKGLLKYVASVAVHSEFNDAVP